jgi:Bacterial protein of unknown function (DUF922)
MAVVVRVRPMPNTQRAAVVRRATRVRHPPEQTRAALPFRGVTIRFLLSLVLALLAAQPVAFAAGSPPPRPAVNTDSTILWQPGHRLVWADFKGVAGPDEKLHALTSADLNVQVSCANDKLTIDVQAVFRPLESWTRSADSAPLLRHEQLHFDLTEVHARLLRQSILKLRMTCAQAQTQLQPLIDAAFSVWQREQDRYDEESRHGLDAKGQARWEQQVAAQLKALPR